MIPTTVMVGKIVSLTLDGTKTLRGTVVAVNKDGSVDINILDDAGHISGGASNVERATSMDHSVPNRFWE